LEIASRFPQSHTNDYGELFLILGIEKDLPGLLAKFEMAKWSNRRSREPVIETRPDLRGCGSIQDESAAYSIECPERFCSTRPDTFAQTTPPSSLFACN